MRRATWLRCWQLAAREFLSTLSLRRATRAFVSLFYGRFYFYPRSPCGERPRIGLTCGGGRIISIHALLAESDVFLYCNYPFKLFISIHALLAESDRFSVFNLLNLSFLSTLSLRRATPSSTVIVILRKNFYPRSPCGERLNGIGLIVHIGGFLSTLSLRRATSDSVISGSRYRHFYPRSPCGERPKALPNSQAKLQFLSTLSLRRATANPLPITSPTTFLSTLSLRRATFSYFLRIHRLLISIHALLAESDKIPVK